MNFGHIHNIIIQRNGGSDFRPMGLISVLGGLISGTLCLKPDLGYLKSDLGGLKSRRTENPILNKIRVSYTVGCFLFSLCFSSIIGSESDLTFCHLQHHHPLAAEGKQFNFCRLLETFYLTSKIRNFAIFLLFYLFYMQGIKRFSL